MDDLRQRFATLDRVPVPDIWSDVEHRLEALGTAAPTRRLVAVKPRWSAPIGSAAPGPRNLAARRNRAALLAAAALIVALLIGAAFAVGSGLIRLASIVPPPEASFSTTPPPASTEPVASPSSGPTATPGGPLGGGEILTHDLARIGDFSTYDVIALDAGTGERTARPLTRSPSPASVAIASKRALAAIGKAVRISGRGSLRVRASPNLSRGACYRRHDQHAGDCDSQNVSHGCFLELYLTFTPAIT
jgi:hypothetical protein